jgi:ubiquinone/menaquinone biosynthesis C-methylase UbiE
MVYIVATDTKHMTFQDESFDNAVTLAGLDNIPHPKPAYQEIYRVLKKDGTQYAINMFVDLKSKT